MKALFVALLVSFSGLAVANSQTEERSIRVTSFQYVENGNQRNKLAELCGRVSGPMTAHDRIVVKADPRSNPASYLTLPDQSGFFCTIIRTFTGQAEVNLWVMGHDEDHGGEGGKVDPGTKAELHSVSKAKTAR